MSAENKDEQEVISVVENYVNQSSSGESVEHLLTGEALNAAKHNKNDYGTQAIVNENYRVNFIAASCAEVVADITKSLGDERYNRRAYKFRLEKQNEDWLIYKVEATDLAASHLTKGNMPEKAYRTLKTYLESTYKEKRDNDYEYLAGELLEISLKNKSVQLNEPDLENNNTKFEIKEITCLGKSEDYLIARVKYYPINVEDKVFETVVDMVKVNESWKISRLDLSKIPEHGE